MEAPARRKKVFVIAGIAVFAIVVAAAIAIGVAVGLRGDAEPPAPPSDDVNLGPKVLDYAPDQVAEDGHWTFVMTETGNSKIDEVFHDFETKPGTPWNITGQFNEVGVFSMKCTKEILMNDAMPLPHMQSNVMYVEPVYIRSHDRTTGLWGLDRLDQTNPTPQSGTFDVPNNLTGEGVTVYVLDSGIRATHSQFTDRILPGRDFVDDGQGTNDCDGHGTHVSGTVAGTTFGVAPRAKIVPVRVLDCNGLGTSAGIVAGINFVAATAVKPAVAQMSLGGPRSTAENAAVERAIARGIPFSIAAGNEDADACNTSPASATNAITVGAIDKDTDQRSTFSNWGTCLDIFAPGNQIISAGIASDNAQVSLSGTSMAAPHVAGVMALYLQKRPLAAVTEVNAALINGALNGKVVDPKGSPNKLLNVNFLANPATSTSAPRVSTSAVPTTATSAPRTTVIPTTATSAPTTATSTSAPRTSTSAAPTSAPTTATSATRTTVATSAPRTSTSAPRTSTSAPPATTAAPARTRTEDGYFRRRGQARYHPSGLFFINLDPMVMQATLDGPDDADMDLALLKWRDGRWRVVAESSNVLSQESITTMQGPGFYSWRVVCFKGDGAYTITFTY
eukprot:TRINITY_DN2736_c0_g3_i4.p1 TRINITY_DN2736_c0_g3~~TRINITY_DN2736_c0_g3_i4.p1  ORF type:complete len:620 (-),score=180.36 TRINITY_DN2736_c0_g3_i4:27-1886(-)